MATYTLFDEIAAHHVNPLPEEHQTHHLAVIRGSFLNLTTKLYPLPSDWQNVSTAINLMETLIQMGELADPDGLHADTVKAMQEASKRISFQMSPEGVQAVHNLLEDYAEVLKVLPHRTMIQAYRKTEAKVVKLFGQHTRKKGVTGRF